MRAMTSKREKKLYEADKGWVARFYSLQQPLRDLPDMSSLEPTFTMLLPAVDQTEMCE